MLSGKYYRIYPKKPLGKSLHFPDKGASGEPWLYHLSRCLSYYITRPYTAISALPQLCAELAAANSPLERTGSGGDLSLEAGAIAQRLNEHRTVCWPWLNGSPLWEHDTFIPAINGSRRHRPRLAASILVHRATSCSAARGGFRREFWEESTDDDFPFLRYCETLELYAEVI